MRTKILITWMIFVTCVSLSATAISPEDSLVFENHNEIRISVGYNRSLFKDVNFSPLNYTDNSVMLLLSYIKRTKRDHRFYSNLHLRYGNLSTDASPFLDATPVHIALKIGFVKKVVTVERHSIGFGGELFSDNQMVFYDGTESVTFLFAHGMGLVASDRFYISEKQSLHFAISLPVAFLLARPPYTGWDKEVIENQDRPFKLLTDGHFTSLHEYFLVDWSGQYHYQWRPKIVLTATHSIRYQHTSHRKSFKSLSNQFLLGVNFKF